MTFSERFLQSLPEGADPSDVRIIQCAATVVPVEQMAPEEEMIVAQFVKARPDQVNEKGKPTIMRVMAWMVHEGVNGNNQRFIGEELKQAAVGLFQSPNFGVMDFNHSAVRPFSEDPKVIGVWYKATYAFDSKAGKWGILATGMIWSWLFPDIADLLLAEQVRRKKISFSMAAIASSIEFVETTGRPEQILHNPVFFTVSALDVPPADPDAVGLGTEDEDEDEDTLKQKVLQLAQWTHATHSKPNQGDIMEQNELIQQLTEARLTAEQAVKDLEAAHATEKETLAKKVEELEAKIAEMATSMDELKTVRDALAAEHEAALTKVTEMETELAELRTFKSEADAKVAEEAKTAKLASRVAELPESVRLIHAGRDEETRSRVEAKWMAMDDDQWKVYVEDELLPFAPSNMRVSFLERSRQAGNLPNFAPDSESDLSTRAKSLLR